MRNILITGATSGIGLELARIYQQQGDRPILVGRRPLAELSDPSIGRTNYCQIDLALEESHLFLAAWLTARQISTIDLLIHNAGIGWTGSVQDQSPAEIEEMIQVNLKAPISITHTLFSHLVNAKGKVVFISSVTSALPTADFATYTASKAALDGFARSLTIEATGRFSVQVLHPGATRTNMHRKIGMAPEKFETFRPADEVARAMVRAIGRRKRNIAIGFNNKILRWVGRSLPRIVEIAMKKKPTEQGAPVRQPHVVVTGGADGIGKALVERFVQAGYLITVLDIDAEKGNALVAQYGGQVRFTQTDLSDVESIKAAVDQPSFWDSPTVSVLVNNAGISAAGHFEKLDLQAQLKVIDINLTGALVLTTTLLYKKHLTRAHQQVYLSSLSKFVGYPGAAVYAASKDGLASFASSMQAANIVGGQSLTVYPGPTRTAHARRYSPDNSREEKRMAPEAVADQIFRSVVRGKRNLFPGGSAKLFALFGRLLPKAAEGAMKKTIYDKL